MALPRPKKIVEEMEELQELGEIIADEYGWAYTAAFSPGPIDEVKEDAKVRGRKDRGRDRDVADPTGAAVASGVKKHLREELGHVAGKVRRAGVILEEAKELVAGLLARGDTVPGEPRIKKQLVSDAEYRESVRAQRRREARGETWGEA